MKSLACLTASVLLMTTACADAQTSALLVSAQPQIERASFTYAIKAGQTLQLDRIVDVGVKVQGKRPVIIFLYGGGWEGGSRLDPGLAAGYQYFASLGYTVVAIDYRLGIKIAKERKEFTSANGPAMYLRAVEWSVEDLFNATSFVLKQASAWNIDTDQIVLLGGSAGATTSLVAEYNVANETALARAHLPAKFRYAGVISMAGAFWFKPGTPLTFKNKPAPIMFFHGAKDFLVTYDEVQGPFSGYGPVAYFRKFPGPGYPKWFVDYLQGDHVIAGTPFGDEKKEIEAFLQKFVREHQAISTHTIIETDPPKNLEVLLKLLPQKGK